MFRTIHLNVNGEEHQIELDPRTPLLYVLRNDLGLKGPKYGCGSEQCNACKVLVDGSDVPSCKLAVGSVDGLKVITLEGLGSDDALHPLQEAFIEEQAMQCGYCTSGMIIAAQGLLNRTRHPTDAQIRNALSDNICRCGVYERVLRAVKMRIGRPDWEPIYRLSSVESETLQTTSPLPGNLPTSLEQNPELDAWIRINKEGGITVLSGKVEIGQGIKTAVAQIAAEELDVSLARIQVATTDTSLSPNEGITAGSMSLQVSGNAIRYAAAEARVILLGMACEALKTESAPHMLSVKDGMISDPATGRQIDYWELFAGQKFNCRISYKGQPKQASVHHIVGEPVKRMDMLDKARGKACFVHDMALPGMVHGRVVRPPSYEARLVSVDDDAIRQSPGLLQIVRNGDFLGVITEREDQAVRASMALQGAAVWEDKNGTIASSGLYDHLLSQPAESHLIDSGTAVSRPIPPILMPDDAAKTVKATYYRPYHMHASLGPSAAVAMWSDDGLTIWSHTQGPFLLQKAIAQVISMPTDYVRIIHVEGAGCYGHNGADDAALDAALLARALPGKPVSLKWMREDEHMWEPYGAAMVVKMQASLDSRGEIRSWNHDVWSYPHTARPRSSGNTSGLLAAWHLERAWNRPKAKFVMGSNFGAYRNADPIYSLPQKRIVAHLVTNSPLRTSSLRGLGAYANVFAVESFMDELSMTAGVDPVEFRLSILNDERARTVIEAAAQKAGRQPNARIPGKGQGRGIGFAQYKNAQCYCAVIVDLLVSLDDGEVELKRAVIAADAGQIVNPDGLSNQLEGGFFQSASWTLMEKVDFDQTGIKSRDWDSYPILRFSGSPVIDTVLINRPDAPFLGSGEAALGPAAAAIANAIFNAVGVRIRDLPITSDKILYALKGKNEKGSSHSLS